MLDEFSLLFGLRRKWDQLSVKTLQDQPDLVLFYVWTRMRLPRASEAQGNPYVHFNLERIQRFVNLDGKNY